MNYKNDLKKYVCNDWGSFFIQVFFVLATFPIFKWTFENASFGAVLVIAVAIGRSCYGLMIVFGDLYCKEEGKVSQKIRDIGTILILVIISILIIINET